MYPWPDPPIPLLLTPQTVQILDEYGLTAEKVTLFDFVGQPKEVLKLETLKPKPQPSHP